MGKPPNLYSFPTVDELAIQLRSYILDAQNQALDRHDRFRVAVSGGSLPKTLAQSLLPSSSNNSKSEENNNAPANTPQFDKWDVFFADERIVPLDHADSNYKAVKDAWLDQIPAALGTPTVFPIDTAKLDDLDEVADAYEQELVKAFAQRDSVRVPMFDLILLGCGPDGHTCSLFPGSPLLRQNEAWILSIGDSPKPPARRITFSLPVASHGIKIAFVATGEGKKEILHKIFDTEEGHSLPSGMINDLAQERVSWFTDAAAIEGVQFPQRRGSL